MFLRFDVQDDVEDMVQCGIKKHSDLAHMNSDRIKSLPGLTSKEGFEADSEKAVLDDFWEPWSVCPSHWPSRSRETVRAEGVSSAQGNPSLIEETQMPFSFRCKSLSSKR